MSKRVTCCIKGYGCTRGLIEWWRGVRGLKVLTALDRLLSIDKGFYGEHEGLEGMDGEAAVCR